jgi:hypothetical protein
LAGRRTPDARRYPVMHPRGRGNPASRRPSRGMPPVVGAERRSTPACTPSRPPASDRRLRRARREARPRCACLTCFSSPSSWRRIAPAPPGPAWDAEPGGDR